MMGEQVCGTRVGMRSIGDGCCLKGWDGCCLGNSWDGSQGVMDSTNSRVNRCDDSTNS